MAASEVTQIRIGNNRVGLVGLLTIFQELEASHANATDDAVANELYTRLGQLNYIPDTVQDLYKKAFVREFRKYLGQPYEPDAHSGGLSIKVLGAGCNVCDGIENDLMVFLGETGIAADLEHVKDPKEIAAYGASGTPALVINGKVVHVGGSPSRQQLNQWISDAGVSVNPEKKTAPTAFIKNIPFSQAHQLTALVDYEEGRVVSRTFAQKAGVSVTLFAFDAGEGLSTHTAPGDAMLQVLDGEARVTIDGKHMNVGAGQVVVMPANVPHAVNAENRFKMLLIVVK